MPSDLNVPFKKPDLISDVTSNKVEDLLLDFLYMLFEKLHNKDGPGFDESLDFVEDLLMYEEDAYEEIWEAEAGSVVDEYSWGRLFNCFDVVCGDL